MADRDIKKNKCMINLSGNFSILATAYKCNSYTRYIIQTSTYMYISSKKKLEAFPNLPKEEIKNKKTRKKDYMTSNTLTTAPQTTITQKTKNLQHVFTQMSRGSLLGKV